MFMFTALPDDRPSALWQSYLPIGGLYLVGPLNSSSWVTLHPTMGILLLFQWGLSLIQLLYSGASITDCSGRPRENSSHLWVPECAFISCWYLRILLPGPKLSCPTTSRYRFSLSVPNREVEHPPASSSAAGEAVWVVTSAKSCSSTGSDSTWLNRVVWGHLLVDPRWIAPKPWTTSQWLKVTCSRTVSLNSTMLPCQSAEVRTSWQVKFFHPVL